MVENGLGHLAWTSPKFGITTKMAEQVIILGWNKKIPASHYKQVDFILVTEFKAQNPQTLPISLLFLIVIH